jgi:succinate dehydrogenase/fumarate reductase cytochrome b subunit
MGAKMREGRTFASKSPSPVSQPSLDDLRSSFPDLDGRRVLERRLFRSRGRANQYGIGAWAWLANRICSAVLVVYVAVHVLTLAFAPAVYGTAWFTVLAIIALIALTFHGLNGLRLIALDLGFFVTHRTQRLMIRGQIAMSAIAAIAGVIRAIA